MRELYRYVDMKAYSEDGPPILVLVAYEVQRETPKCWIIRVDGRERRVLKGFGKRFAHETVEWAQLSWKKRKRWQESHLRHQLAHVEMVRRVEEQDFPLPKVTSPDEFSIGGGGYREFHHPLKRLLPQPPDNVYGGLFF